VVGLAHVAIPGGFAFGIKVSVIGGARGFPDALARLLVQRGDVLLVNTVKSQNDQVAINDWR
jgi:NAD(P)-dependent dehydrogenase (short-subunit alcohol dehydrogenase family)